MFVTAATPAGTMGRLSTTECTYLPSSLNLAAGPSHSQSHHRVPLNDLVAFIHWDLLFNDRLVNFSSIFAQQTGCPLGGSCSAQYASIVLNYLERSVDWTLLPPIVRNTVTITSFMHLPSGLPSPNSLYVPALP